GRARGPRPEAGARGGGGPPNRGQGAALAGVGRAWPSGAYTRPARSRARPPQARHRFDIGAPRAARGRTPPPRRRAAGRRHVLLRAVWVLRSEDRRAVAASPPRAAAPT